MVCHYVKGLKGERVLIPECWPVVISGNKKDCTCNLWKHKKDKIEVLELKVEKLEKTIAELKSKINAQK